MNPFRILRECRADESGNVLLLSGTMIFLVMMMAVITVDTNRAIYNRIIAQNAVDAAAETAALWQARGCNVMQHLNNLHHDVNGALFIAENVALIGCAVAPAQVIAYDAAKLACLVPFCQWACVAQGILFITTPLSCSACFTAPIIDWAQEKFAVTVLALQGLVSKMFPICEFAYANEMAKANGADNLLEVVPQYLEQALNAILPELHLSDLATGVPDTLKAVLGDLMHIYAFPLDPSSLSLQAKTKDGENLPWKWDADGAELAYGAGSFACTAAIDGTGGLFAFGDPIKTLKTLGWSEEWGWKDKYYIGGPGFMTWIAGKTNETELAGLGNLIWLAKPDSADMDPAVSTMYTKNILVTTSPLRIPPFIAIASSQTEPTSGTIVPYQDDDSKWARPYIIPVYFQRVFGKDVNPIPGTEFFIFH